MRPSPTSTPDAAQVAAAGKNIVTWLTVLQVVSLLWALLYVAITALSPQTSVSGLPRSFDLGLAAWQVLFALLYFLALQWTKGWMTDVRRWATGEGPANEASIAREDKALGRWIVVGQWLPLLTLLLAGPLVYSAMGQLDPALLASPELSAAGVSPAQARNLAQLSTVIALVAVGLPSFIINYLVLGWIGRWMRGVSDAALEREARETRLPELAQTLSRWFTFFQVLLGLAILIILIVPLLPAQPGNNTLADRLNLLVSFLNLALWTALLQWSKIFLAGVTAWALGKRR